MFNDAGNKKDSNNHKTHQNNTSFWKKLFMLIIKFIQYISLYAFLWQASINMHLIIMKDDCNKIVLKLQSCINNVFNNG